MGDTLVRIRVYPPIRRVIKEQTQRTYRIRVRRSLLSCPYTNDTRVRSNASVSRGHVAGGFWQRSGSLRIVIV